jgi:hypothetical protein
MYVWLVVDPPTTAGAGIPAANGFSVTSNKSGPGSFHLYAVDDVIGSFGISGLYVTLKGTLTSLFARPPFAQWNDVDELGPYLEGFTYRNAYVFDGTIALGQSSSPSPTPLINGFGQIASNFAAETPDAAQFLGTTTSGQWGNYADPNTKGTIPNTGDFRNALLLAEGTFTGLPPTIDVSPGGTSIGYWTQNPDTTPNPSSAGTTVVLPFNPFIEVPEPGSVSLIGVAVALFARFGLRSRCRRR